MSLSAPTRRRLGRLWLLASLLVILSVGLRPSDELGPIQTELVVPLASQEDGSYAFAPFDFFSLETRLPVPAGQPGPAREAYSGGPQSVPAAPVRAFPLATLPPAQSRERTSSTTATPLRLRQNAETAPTRAGGGQVARPSLLVLPGTSVRSSTSLAEVRQRGTGNEATVRQIQSTALAVAHQNGAGNRVDILQTATPARVWTTQTGDGHTVRLSQAGPGYSEASVAQLGSRHTVETGPLGDGVQLDAQQSGTANRATIAAFSSGALRHTSLTLVQNGTRNLADFHALDGGQLGAPLSLVAEQIGAYNSALVLTHNSRDQVIRIRQETAEGSSAEGNTVILSLNGHDNQVSTNQQLLGGRSNYISSTTYSSTNTLRLSQVGSGNVLTTTQY
jgi:hypothetical protein